MRGTFPINYVYGFSSRGFSYFITVQKKSTANPKPFITKLVRVCQRDVNYHSYVEVPSICQSESGYDYNLAQAAQGTLLGVTNGLEMLHFMQIISSPVHLFPLLKYQNFCVPAS